MWVIYRSWDFVSGKMVSVCNVLNVFFLNAVIKKNKKRKRHKSKSSDRSHKIYAKEAKFILMATHHRRKWRKCLSACVFFFFFFHVCEISL